MFKKLSLLFLVIALSLPMIGGCAGQQQAALKIGLEGPMTGDYAYEGQGFEKAVQLLVDQTNEAGGLLGRQVELVIEDDAGDPTQAALVAQRLVDAGVVLITLPPPNLPQRSTMTPASSTSPPPPPPPGSPRRASSGSSASASWTIARACSQPSS
jgi:hypothetical protein